MNFNLFSMINPGLSINLVRNLVKKQLKKEVKNFDIAFLVEKNQVFFIIEGINYEFPDSNIKALVEKQAKTVLKEGDKLNVVILKVSETDKIEAEIYYQNKFSEKKKVIHKLN